MLPLKTANGKPGTGNSDQVNSGVSSVPWLCPGARRSFFCRMKIKPASLIYKEDVDQVCTVLEKCLHMVILKLHSIIYIAKNFCEIFEKN